MRVVKIIPYLELEDYKLLKENVIVINEIKSLVEEEALFKLIKMA